MNVLELDKQYVAPTYGRFPVSIVKGAGSRMWDEDGKEYIDMGTGIGVNALGLCDPGWIRAITEQLQVYQHTSNLYYTAPCAQLAEKLCKKTGMKKVFFSNSGAEANECAIKAARKYAADRKGADTFTILTLNNSFHGRTLATLAATGQEVFHQQFLPMPQGFLSIDPTVAALEQAVAENKVAAILFEIVRGEGGVLPLEKEFVDAMVRIAQEKDILLMADEVQCGNGRTGKLYGYMHYGFTPDIVTTAKGLAGGLPMGATLLGSKTEAVFAPGLHGSTFGGNPIAAAAANYVIDNIDDSLLADVTEKSAYIFESLKDAKGITDVTGLGLMIGVKTVKPAGDVVRLCMERGVLPLTAKDKVRLLPALNIPMEDLKKAISILKDVCAEGLE